MDSTAIDGILSSIFSQTQQCVARRRPEDDLLAGVIARIDGQRVFALPGASLGALSDAFTRLHCLLAVQMSNLSILSVCDSIFDKAPYYWVDEYTRVQVLETMDQLLLIQDDHSAAFIRADRVLVVWGDDLPTIIFRSQTLLNSLEQTTIAIGDMVHMDRIQGLFSDEAGYDEQSPRSPLPSLPELSNVSRVPPPPAHMASYPVMYPSTNYVSVYRCARPQYSPMTGLQRQFGGLRTYTPAAAETDLPQTVCLADISPPPYGIELDSEGSAESDHQASTSSATSSATTSPTSLSSDLSESDVRKPSSTESSDMSKWGVRPKRRCATKAPVPKPPRKPVTRKAPARKPATQRSQAPAPAPSSPPPRPQPARQPSARTVGRKSKRSQRDDDDDGDDDDEYVPAGAPRATKGTRRPRKRAAGPRSHLTGSSADDSTAPPHAPALRPTALPPLSPTAAPDDKLSHCAFCILSFTRPKDLLRHNVFHCGENAHKRRLVCSVCGEKLSRKDSAKRHAKVHLKKRYRPTDIIFKLEPPPDGYDEGEEEEAIVDVGLSDVEGDDDSDMADEEEEEL